MSVDIPMHLDGKAQLISPEDSEKYEEMIEFINLTGKYRVYPYPHPEPITLPMNLPDVKRVTNKGSVLPEKYYELTRAIHACGLSSKDPIEVNGQQVIPHDFATAFLIDQREKILDELNFGEARGCVKIVVKGKKKKTLEPRTYVFYLMSEGAAKGQGLGEGTGIPAAMGTILMAKGKIKEKGVVFPESAVPVWEFLDLMKKIFSIGKGDSESSPLIFQSIDADGNVKQMEF
jgi:saccharopine dehydrogenase (NAD+, L-lysine-forming)